MRRNRVSVIVFFTCSIILLFMLLVLVKEWYFQIDRNARVQRLKIIEYVEGQPVEQIDPDALSAYLSALDQRNLSHNVIVAIIGAFFTFMAFYVQYSFNETQKQDISRERFENGYAHHLDIFREIWRDMAVPNAGKGKVAIHYMFYEYKAIFRLVHSDSCLGKMDLDRQNKVSFSIFMNGVSLSFGSRITICKLDDKEEASVNRLCEKLLSWQKKSEEGKEKMGVKYIRDYKGRGIKYFDGHRMRLVPYFKYLITIFDYLEGSENRLNNKDNFIRHLSSEMSDHEIGLIYSYFKFKGLTEYDKYLNSLLATVDCESKEDFVFDSPAFIRTKEKESTINE